METKALTILATGKLKNGKAYDIVVLEEQHAGLVAALHQQTLDGLNPNDKAFMLPKSQAYFTAHMKKGGGNAVIGIVCEGQLVAQTLIAHPLEKWDEAGMVDMEPPCAPEEVSVMQAVSVDPAFRGMGLMNLMIDEWMMWANTHNRFHLVAEIDIRNPASWGSFLKSGLHLHSIGIDSADGSLVYNAHETVEGALVNRLSPVFNKSAWPDMIACRIDNIEKQQKLFRKGYECIGYNKPQSLMIFAKKPPPVHP